MTKSGGRINKQEKGNRNQGLGLGNSTRFGSAPCQEGGGKKNQDNQNNQKEGGGGKRGGFFFL